MPFPTTTSFVRVDITRPMLEVATFPVGQEIVERSFHQTSFSPFVTFVTSTISTRERRRFDAVSPTPSRPS
jgi:hypothetical protein